MDPISKLKAKHPFFRGITRDNFFDYFSLIKPHLLMARADRLEEDEIDAVTPCLAGELGALMLEQFVETHEDRTKYLLICDYMMDHVLKTRNPAIHQVVIFDMVMDASAYRLPQLGDCHVFEMCVNASVLEEKERCLTVSGAPLLAKTRTTVQVDFRKDGWHHALLKSGFNPDEPTCWIMASYLTYMSAADGAHLMEVIASLSAPKTEVYADMFVGKAAELTTNEGKSTKTAQFFQMNGDNGCVFQSLREWIVELLVRYDGEGGYYGTAWDPEKLGQWAVPKSEKNYLGPWFIVRFNLPEREEEEEEEVP